MTERVTPSELARHLGVSRQAIYNLQERGALQRDPDGKLDLDVATAAIAAAVHPFGKTAAAVNPAAPATPPSKPASIDYHQAKTLRELTEAKIAKLKLLEMQGKVVPILELEHQLRAAHTSAREFLLAEARPLAQKIQGQNIDEAETSLILAFNTFLIRLANWNTGHESEDDNDETDEEDELE